MIVKKIIYLGNEYFDDIGFKISKEGIKYFDNIAFDIGSLNNEIVNINNIKLNETDYKKIEDEYYPVSNLKALIWSNVLNSKSEIKEEKYIFLRFKSPLLYPVKP